MQKHCAVAQGSGRYCGEYPNKIVRDGRVLKVSLLCEYQFENSSIKRKVLRTVLKETELNLTFRKTRISHSLRRAV